MPSQVRHVQPRERPVLPQVRFPGRVPKPSAWAKELILSSFAHRVKILVRPSTVTDPRRPCSLSPPPYSTGHSGKHGHEFLEFEYSHGRLRYANNSNYRNDSLIRKESTPFSSPYPCSLLIFCPSSVWIGPLIVKELKRIVESSEITKCVNRRKRCRAYADPRHNEGKMTRIGQKRTSLESKSSRFVLATITLPLK